MNTPDDPLSPYIQPPEFHENRLGTLRASDVKCLVEGREKDIIRLWRVKTGRYKKAESCKVPSLAALMGKALEDLNWRYFSKTTGRKVWGQGTALIHPQHEWIGVTLDGITTTDDGREAYLECKAVDPFKDFRNQYRIHYDEFNYLIAYRRWKEVVVLPILVREYKAQVHVAMACGGWEVAVLCAMIGNEQFTQEIEFDPWFWLELLELMRDFWSCVQEDRRPDTSVMRGISS